MIYTHKELKEKYGFNYQIQKAVKEGNLYKIESGIYSDKQNNHYLDIFVKNIQMQLFLEIVVDDFQSYSTPNYFNLIKREC